MRKTESGISVECHDDFEGILTLQPEWDAFVESSASDIYLTFDWCHIWWKHYGASRQLVLYVFREGEALVGLLPLFVEKLWMGPVWLKVAKLVGADSTTSMVNFAIRDEHAREILSFTYADLVQEKSCDGVVFGPLAENYPCLAQVLGSVPDCEHVTLARDRVVSPYTRFPLPEEYSAYIDSLPKRQRTNLKRDMNLIERSFSLTHDMIATGTGVEQEFMKFVEMHTEQWRVEGKQGHFHDWPQAVEFNLAMALRMAELGRLRLIRLLSGESVLSYQLCYSFGGRCFWRLPARLVGAEYDKFAFGRVGLASVIELAIDEGDREVEGGAGHYEYKIKLGAQEHALHVVTVVRNRADCRMRFGIFSCLSELLNLCYYRVWFLKIGPKLPLKRRPLWRLWIRTRL